MLRDEMTKGRIVKVVEYRGLSRSEYMAEVLSEPKTFGAIYVVVKHPGQQPNTMGQLTTWEVRISDCDPV